MLARSDLVVDVLHRDPHRLEVGDRPLPPVGREVQRRLVEIPGPIEELRLLEALQVEELELRTDVERVPELARPLELTLQHGARVALEGRAVGVHDVTEQPRDLGLGLPGDQLERRGIGDRDHVGLLDPAEPVDR